MNIDFVEGEKAYIPYVVIVAIEAAHHHAMSFSVSLRGRLLLGSLPNMRVFFVVGKLKVALLTGKIEPILLYGVPRELYIHITQYLGEAKRAIRSNLATNMQKRLLSPSKALRHQPAAIYNKYIKTP